MRSLWRANCHAEPALLPAGPPFGDGAVLAGAAGVALAAAGLFQLLLGRRATAERPVPEAATV